MQIAMVVLHRDRSYYFIFNQGERVFVGEHRNAGLYVPEIGMEMHIAENNGVITVDAIKDSNTMAFSTSLNSPLIIDRENRIALYFSRHSIANQSLYLSSDCIVDIGNDEEMVLDDGKYNDIIIHSPRVSHHHARIIRKDGITTIYDTGSTNGIFLNGQQIDSAEINNGDVISILTIRLILKDGVLFFENIPDEITLKDVSGIEDRQAAQITYSDSYNRFQRAPRLSRFLRQSEITIERPPHSAGTPQINWLNVLVTPLVTVALMLVLVFVMGMSAVMLIMSGVMSVTSAIIAIANYRSQKKKNSGSDKKVSDKYQTYLAEIEQTISDGHLAQKNQLLSANPSPMECLDIARNRKSMLWEREPEDDDFLWVRLGIGQIQAAVIAQYHRDKFAIEDNPLEEQAEKIAEESTTISNAPVLCDLAGNKRTGIIGNKEDTYQLVRNMLVELSTSHSYEDVRIILIASRNEIDEWAWLRWLPHCSDDQKKNRFLVFTQSEIDETLEDAIGTISSRQEDKQNHYSSSDSSKTPHYLFIITSQGLLTKSLRDIVFSSVDLGCSSVFIEKRRNALPKECDWVVEVSEGSGDIYSSSRSQNKMTFRVDELSRKEAEKLSRSLAPLFAGENSSETSLPVSVSFLQGYGVQRPEDLNISRRWANARTYESLSVPIAIGRDGKPFYFDIHKKKHGSHGVVAGQTQWGKTDLVMSWLLSLAVNYSPEDVSFVIIDWKGTSMVSPFYGLPHLAGGISNLDVKKGNVERCLASIKNEVTRRENIIDRYSHLGVKDIEDLTRMRKNGKIRETLSRLMIVIDEFAEFKKTYPDFGKEIDSLTMTGSSLGISVVLMAQNLTGVLSTQSEANVRFRWCLHVANSSFSRELLGKAGAERLPYPGRAIIKVGDDEIYEEVQGFWSSAPYNPSMLSQREMPTPIATVSINGKRDACESFGKGGFPENTMKENRAIVDYIAKYCRENGIPNAEKIWTDPLPERISLNHLLPVGFNGRVWPVTKTCAPVVGKIDDPANQIQYLLTIDFAKAGHTIVYGAPVTGKTTFIQTLVISTAMTRKPDEVSIYIMDFGGRNMMILRDLPHVGGIAFDNEPERLKKLMTLLEDTLQRRIELFSSAGVSNVQAYRDITNERIPDIIVAIDGFGTLLKSYPEMDEMFIRLSGNAANYGIYLVLTANAVNVVPIRISQNIKTALALQLPDKGDYSSVVGRVPQQLPAVLGRGYVKGNPPLEFQTALPAPGDSDKDISENIRRIAQIMNTAWAGILPDPIPEMPKVVPYGSIRLPGIVLGLSTEKVRPVEYDYGRQHFLLISGTAQSGKTTLLTTLARQFKEKLNAKVIVFKGKDTTSDFSNCADVVLSSSAEIDEFVEHLRPEMQRRQSKKQANETCAFQPILISVDDYADFFKGISNETALRLQAIIKLAEGLGIFLVVAADAYEIASMASQGEAVASALSKGRQAVMLGGCLNDHGAIQTNVSYSQKGIAVKEYEGFYVSNKNVTGFKAMNKEE